MNLITLSKIKFNKVSNLKHSSDVKGLTFWILIFFFSTFIIVFRTSRCIFNFNFFDIAFDFFYIDILFDSYSYSFSFALYLVYMHRYIVFLIVFFWYIGIVKISKWINFSYAILWKYFKNYNIFLLKFPSGKFCYLFIFLLITEEILTVVKAMMHDRYFQINLFKL